ncbi:hypothetical protein I302_105846 [Kwoniella bestiolae CBS 10118]|uniref:Uncharacterized protein n=1 Tax=Kwoniella bestiolae CBS 10118 TaxID=1296100 RepID=A0A1B9G2B4_9TREE|nr:hypothetical protein I302_04970 [Kwoniella bestiolae CBS 10118]OCF25160.1 hypothetical protein I302_04970 [Kwoniella bestiolae CBS 10118]
MSTPTVSAPAPTPDPKPEPELKQPQPQLEDQVLPPERPLALLITQYSDAHPDTYTFIARTTSSNIIVQVRYDDENDTIGIEGYFTETPALLRHIERIQEDVWRATREAGLEGYPGVKTLEEMREWRFDGTNFPKRSEPPWGDGPAPWERDDGEGGGGGCELKDD